MGRLVPRHVISRDRNLYRYQDPSHAIVFRHTRARGSLQHQTAPALPLAPHWPEIKGTFSCWDSFRG